MYIDNISLYISLNNMACFNFQQIKKYYSKILNLQCSSSKHTKKKDQNKKF